MPNTEQFVQLQGDPTSSLETKAQAYLSKYEVPTDVYVKVYPTGPSPGKFHGAAKVRKLSEKYYLP